MLCVAGKIFLTNYTKKQWIWVVVLGILAILIERHSGEKGVLICYAVAIGMKDISLKKVMQIGTVIYGMTMYGMVTYYGIFLEKSNYIEDVRLGVGATFRYSLGYPHPNNLLATYLAFITMYIYCLDKKYNWKHAICLIFGNVYLYSYCMSYTGLITCSLMIILPLYLIKFRKGKLGVIEYSIGATALPICLLYSIFAPYFIPDDLLEIIRRYLYNLYSRLELSKMHVVPENIHLFGTRVEKVTTSMYSLDNSFLYTLVFCGVIFLVIIIGAYFYMMDILIKEKRNLELIITCIFLLEGIIEPLLFNSSFKNISLFLLGSIIWKNEETLKESDRSIILRIPKRIKEVVLDCNNVYNSFKKEIITKNLCISGTVFIISLVYQIIGVENIFSAIEILRENMAIALLVYVVVGVIISCMQYRKLVRGNHEIL